MNGLIIREPWLSKILSGSKTWELRTKPTSYRGRVGLIRKGSGLVVAVADLVDSLLPLAATAFAAARHQHGIPIERDAEVLAAGWVYPWVLRDVRALRQPVLAGQKPGQVIWVPLPEVAMVAIAGQVGPARPYAALDGVR